MEIKQLKAEIKSMATEIRSHKSSAQGSARNGVWMSTLSFLKHKARMQLLAYAMLRDVPYKVAETNARPLPDPHSIGNLLAPWQKGGDTNHAARTEWTEKAAKWLKAESPPATTINVEVAKF